MEPGVRIGQYEVVASLGKGGMGEVYRARDTRLERDVAIKVLPEELSADAERLERFEREARMLAQLSHANIATVHGLEEASDGTRFIVMECVEGKTLAERVAAGPLEMAEVVALGGQMAQALAAAHEAGIIHRDLKPANVMITAASQVKVLDFGLAKSHGGGSRATDLSASPTMLAATATGVILGTAAYMSPEQARGKPLDRRTDIWSLGAVLFEMLTGTPPFGGDTVSDTLASILKEEPDWESLPSTTPPALIRVLQRCLRREPARRMRDAADVRLELEEALEEDGAAVADGAEVPSGRIAWLPWAVAALMGLVAFVSFYGSGSERAQNTEPIRMSLPHPMPIEGELAFSPDGSTFVFTGIDSDGTEHLYLRALGSYEVRPIDGSELADAPFFSPDGQWVAFTANARIWKVPAAGGQAFPVEGSEGARGGGAWGPDGQIAIQLGFGAGLSLVPADGGAPRPLTRVDPSRAERHHTSPEFLPGGQELLFSVYRGVSGETSEVAVASIPDGEVRVLTRGAGARYVSTGHLVFRRRGSLMAAPFDLERLELTGEAVVVVPELAPTRGILAPLRDFDVSLRGDLAYAAVTPGFSAETELVWGDREGNVEPVTDRRARYHVPRLSPDGSRVLLSILGDEGFAVWIHDLERGTFSRLTDEGSSAFAVWSPDGSEVAFSSDRDGPINVYTMSASGTGPVTRHGEGYTALAGSWSPRGDVLLTTVLDDETFGDIGAITLGDGASLNVLSGSAEDEYSPQFSPAGDWFVSAAFGAGGGNVYLYSYPDLGRRLPVATTPDDAEPHWSPPGDELFFVGEGDRFFSVSVETRNGEVSIGRPVELFSLDQEGVLEGITGYDVARDGSRFLMVRRPPEHEEAGKPDGIRVVLDWTAELERLVPRARR